MREIGTNSWNLMEILTVAISRYIINEHRLDIPFLFVYSILTD